MTTRMRQLHLKLLSGVAALALSATAALADGTLLSLPEQPLAQSLKDIARATGVNILFTPDAVANIKARALKGQMTARVAVNALLAGTNLQVVSDDSGGLIVHRQLTANDTGAPAAPTKSTNQSAGPAATNEKGEGAEEKNSGNDENKVEKVTVTGSRIRGSDRFAPVQRYRRDDVDRAGQATAADVVRDIPQNFGGGVTPTGQGPVSSTGAGGAAINLRGLGNSATLTLINGRRLAASGVDGNYVDISSIPISAIDRVEVLTDGASAIYGSDAVAGVVNFILRNDFDGAETRARVQVVTKGHAEEYQFAQTLGVSDSGNYGLVSFEHREAYPLLLRAKDATLAPSDPSQLLPRSDVDSLFGSAGLALNDQTRVEADALFSRRETIQRTLNLFGDLSVDVVNVEQFGTAATIEHSLSDQLTISISPAYATTDFSGSSLYVPTGETTNDASESKVFSVDALLQAVLLPMPAGDIEGVFGGQVRREEFLGRTTFEPGGFVASNAANDRDIWAAFVEFSVPLVGLQNRVDGVEELALSLAARYEDYSDAGQSTNPKVGLRWTPFEGFSVRASYARSFRAPGLFQQVDEIGSAAIVDYVDPESPTGESVGLIVNGQRNDLKPEKSESYSLGFDYRPSFLQDLLLRVTAYDVSYNDRIVTPVAELTFNPFIRFVNFPSTVDRDVTLAELQDFVNRAPVFFNFTTFFPGGSNSSLDDVTILLDQRPINAASTRISGVDLFSTYRIKLEAGELDLSVNASYLAEFDERFSPQSIVVTRLDRVFQPIDWRVRGGLSWTDAGLNISGFVNYVDSYSDPNNGDATIPSWTTLDISAAYEIRDQDSHLDGISATLAVVNLLDEGAPRLPAATIEFGPTGRSVFYDTSNADPVGRRVSVQVTKRW